MMTPTKGFLDMALRDRFPAIEDIIQSRADDLGAEIVLERQRRPNEMLFPSNYRNDLARQYGRENADREFASAVSEAIQWAYRELLVVQHYQNTSSPMDCLMLSRRGLKFTRDHLDRIRLESILPRGCSTNASGRRVSKSSTPGIIRRRSLKRSRNWKSRSERQPASRRKNTACQW
jgi:hypothetical protein